MRMIELFFEAIVSVVLIAVVIFIIFPAIMWIVMISPVLGMSLLIMLVLMALAYTFS